MVEVRVVVDAGAGASRFGEGAMRGGVLYSR